MTPPDLQDYDFKDTDDGPEPRDRKNIIAWTIGFAFAVVCFVGLAQRWGWWS